MASCSGLLNKCKGRVGRKSEMEGEYDLLSKFVGSGLSISELEVKV